MLSDCSNIYPSKRRLWGRLLGGSDDQERAEKLVRTKYKKKKGKNVQSQGNDSRRLKESQL